MKIKLKI